MGRAIRIILLCVFAVTAHAARAERRVALVVGNAAYQYTTPLRNPANDANDISAVLRKLEFEVTTSVDGSAEALSEALLRFSAQLKGADVALFFYAGHGAQFGGRNYLIPVDARMANEFVFRREAVAVDDVLSVMEASSKVTMVFLDACRNNPLLDTLTRSLTGTNRTASTARGLARMDSNSNNTLIVFATAPGDVAEDGSGRNSPFVQAFLRHVEAPGADVEVLLKDVTADVRQMTNGRQRPERLSRLERKFSFNPSMGGEAAPKQPVTNRSTDRGQEERLFWESVRESRDRAQLQAYLSRYPQGVFADLARARIEALSTPQLAGGSSSPQTPAAAADAAFTSAVAAGTIAALRDFIDRFPNDARTPRLKQTVADEQAWLDADKDGTTPGYRRYLVLFPTGTYAPVARQKLAELAATPAPTVRSPSVTQHSSAPSPRVVAPWCSERRGFDEDELTICGSPRLSALDGEMTQYYVLARSRSTQALIQRLNADQREWRAERLACERDIGCIESSYLRRMEQLKAW